MNKQTILKITLGMLVVLILGFSTVFVAGVVNNPTGNEVAMSTLLTEVEATSLALANVAGEIKDVELKDGMYEFEILNNGEEFEVLVDESTGVVTWYKDQELTRTQVLALTPPFSESKALAIALARVPGTLEEVEYNLEGERYLYSFEIENNGDDWSVEIDMFTGEVLEVEMEDDDEGESTVFTAATTSSTSSSNRISVEEAKQIAISKVGGRVTDTDQKSIDIVEIEVRTSDGEVDVHIDLNTGIVLQIDRN